MALEYIEQKFVQKNAIERREYQVNLANQAINENCIVVLPTGLGKTTVALLVFAKFLSKGTGGVLFLAPTRVLVNQHYEFLKNNLVLDEHKVKILFNIVKFSDIKKAKRSPSTKSINSLSNYSSFVICSNSFVSFFYLFPENSNWYFFEFVPFFQF